MQAPSDVVYLGQPPLRVDLLRAIDGVDTESLAARAIATEIDGVPLRVIDLSDLITNKRAVGRPQDLIDAEFLERVRASRAKSK
jgi:predicted nucleotidyltransferase